MRFLSNMSDVHWVDEVYDAHMELKILKAAESLSHKQADEPCAASQTGGRASGAKVVNRRKLQGENKASCNRLCKH